MKNQFDKSYFDNKIMDEKISLKREGYIQIVKKLVAQLPPSSKILDVGCGKGTYLKDIHCLRSDLELYGADIGKVKEFLPEYINFDLASGDNLPFEDEKFDFIICFHVLEHIINPVDFLKEFNRVLKKGGYVYIEMPYYKTINAPEGIMNFWSEPTHLKPFTRGSVERILNDNNFEIIKIEVWRTYLTILISPYLLLKRIFLRDYDALSTLYGHLVGHSIGGLGKKIHK